MADTILRVQDVEGRGPYRPGLSIRWSDEAGPYCPPWWVELGWDMMAAHALMDGDYAYGCGFRNSEQMAAWFTSVELSRLAALGFHLAVIKPAIIVAETSRQIVFGASRALNTFPAHPLTPGAA